MPARHYYTAAEVLAMPEDGIRYEVWVPLYWLVAADTRLVEAWNPERTFPIVEDQEISWRPVGASEPLVIRLAELFRAP